MTTPFSAKENIREIEVVLIMMFGVFHPKQSEYCTNDVLQLGHGEVRSRTTATAISEGNPVQMHVFGCVQPPLGLPQVRIWIY